jgi:hypothetical protein
MLHTYETFISNRSLLSCKLLRHRLTTHDARRVPHCSSDFARCFEPYSERSDQAAR